MILTKEEIHTLIKSLMVKEVEVDGHKVSIPVNFTSDSDHGPLITKLSIMLEIAQ